MLTQYRENLKKGQNPHENLIDIIGGFSAPHGWELIARASGGTRARISEHFLETDAFNKCRPATFGHTSRTDMYPKVEYANPAVWSFLRTGLVDVNGNLVDIGMLAKHRKRLRSFSEHPFKLWEKGIEGLIATVPKDDFITAPQPVFRPRKAVEEERPFWIALSGHCQKQEVGQVARRAIYEWMAENFWFPETVGTEVGEVALKECYVTQSSTLGATALEAKVPAVVLSPAACAFWLGCGALNLESHIQVDILTRDDTPVPLIVVVPEFGEILTEEARETALVRFVGGLGLRIAGKPVKKPCILEAQELLLDREQFRRSDVAGASYPPDRRGHQCEVVFRRRDASAQAVARA
jgi:hypothetical protein